MATLPSVLVWGDALRFPIGPGQFEPKAVFHFVVRLLLRTGVRIDLRHDALGLRAGSPNEPNFGSFNNLGNVPAIVLLYAYDGVRLPRGRSLLFDGGNWTPRGMGRRGLGSHRILEALRSGERFRYAPPFADSRHSTSKYNGFMLYPQLGGAGKVRVLQIAIVLWIRPQQIL